MSTGVFVGLITLDCIYQTDKALEPNEKQVAQAVLLAAGGPATNAAVAFRGLGNRAVVIGALGCHPLSAVVRDDLAEQGVDLVDLTPDATTPPPFSSIVVNGSTGDRAVISRNAADRPRPTGSPPRDLLSSADCVLIDGHQMAMGVSVATSAREAGIPVIVDGGSWKAGFEQVLSLTTVAIVSAAFSPPKQGTGSQAIAYLQQAFDIPHVAVTRGDQPILYQTHRQTGQVPVPQIQAVDTLGAGDIFHGAFCHYYIQNPDFPQALSQAAQIAAGACQYFGTRHWLQPSP